MRDAVAARFGHDVEVTEKATRRRFSAEFKKKILLEAEACTRPGELAALLRREGLYSSHLCVWRKAREAGATSALSGKKRGPAPKRDDRDRRIAQLEKENARLQRRLLRADAMIGLQKKVAAIFEIELPIPPDDDENEGTR